MISKMFAAVATLLLLLMAVGQANAQETGEIAFVFISESGAEYTYRLHGPESNFWIGSVHAGSTVVIDGPPGLYGYVLEGPPGVKYTGSIALLADGWADVIFDDFSIVERADNRAPAAESTSTGTLTDKASVVFTSHTGNEYSFTLLGPDSKVWTGSGASAGFNRSRGSAGPLRLQPGRSGRQPVRGALYSGGWRLCRN